MYVWNLQGMRERLRAGPMTQSEQITYLLAATLFSWANGTTPFLGPKWWNLLIGVFYMASVGLAIYYVYRCNGGRNGQRFVERYIGLCWILMVRFFVLVTLPLLALRDLFNNVFGPFGTEGTIIGFASFALAQLGYYWILGIQMRELARSAT